MEALKTTRQAPSPWWCSFMLDLGGISHLDLFVGVRGGRLKCGFGTCVDPLVLVGTRSFPSPCAGRLPSSSAASSRIVGFGFQSLMENWKFGGFKFDAYCPSSKLQNQRCLLVAVDAPMAGERAIVVDSQIQRAGKFQIELGDASSRSTAHSLATSRAHARSIVRKVIGAMEGLYKRGF